MHFSGLFIGAATFLIIGLFHPVVIKAEYYWGKKVWPFFLAVGVLALMLSIFINHFLFSTILGVFSFSSFWSIRELFEQEQRVKKGWFPENPKRAVRNDSDSLFWDNRNHQ